MAQPNDAFSNSVNDIRGLLHASIGDIDALLRGNPAEQAEAVLLSQAERDTLTARTADLDDALQKIHRLEGSVLYYKEENRKTKSAFDNLKKDYQQLQANVAGPGIGSKEASLREEVRSTKSSLSTLKMKYTQLQIDHKKAITKASSQNSKKPSPPTSPPKNPPRPQGTTSLQTQLDNLRTQHTALEKVHAKCTAQAKLFIEDRSAWSTLYAGMAQLYHHLRDDHSTCPAKPNDAPNGRGYDAAKEFGKLAAQLALLQIEHKKCGVQSGVVPEADLNLCQAEKQQLEAEKLQLTAQNQKLMAEKNQLTEEGEKYRDIIRNAKRSAFGAHQPTDAELRASAVRISTALQGIAYKLSESTTKPDFSDNNANNSDTSHDSDDDDTNASDSDGLEDELDDGWSSQLFRKTVLWHLLYSRLDKKILSVPIFGLQDDPLSANAEVNLRAFEGALERQAAGNNQVLDPRIQEWRSRTVELASRFVGEFQDPLFPSLKQRVVSDLLEYLGPPMRTMDQTVQERIKESIADVCAEAYNLKLLLRRFPEKIVFEAVDGEIMVDIFNYNIMHTRGTQLPTHPVGTLTLMGALVKYPLEGGRVVLERPIIVFDEGEEPEKPASPSKKDAPKKPAPANPTKTTEIKYEKPTAESVPTSEEL